uniref:Uncharacterized protein n=1 Tax=Cyanistes caeruleus TaxID=156563 RepID=A0A8C0VD02_CYACU
FELFGSLQSCFKPRGFSEAAQGLDSQDLQCLSSILEKGKKNSFSFIPPTLVHLWSPLSLTSGKPNEDQASQAGRGGFPSLAPWALAPGTSRAGMFGEAVGSPSQGFTRT